MNYFSRFPLFSSTVLASFLVVGNTANAQSAASVSAPLEAPTANILEKLPPTEARRDGDASVDRNILSPTAETLQKGELTFNSYQLFLAGFTYGVTDDLQISATTLLPFADSLPLLVAVSAKYRLVKSDRSIFSLQPQFAFATKDSENGGYLGLQGLFDHMLDDQGKVALTLGFASIGGFGSSSGDTQFLDGLLFTTSAGLSARVGNAVKLIGELVLPGTYRDGAFDLKSDSFLFNYGLRFFNRSLSADLSFIRPLGDSVESGLLMGIPFVNFSARI